MFFLIGYCKGCIDFSDLSINQQQHLKFCFVLSSSSLRLSTAFTFFKPAFVYFPLSCCVSFPTEKCVASCLQLPCRSNTVFSLNHSEKVKRRTWLSEPEGSTGTKNIPRTVISRFCLFFWVFVCFFFVNTTSVVGDYYHGDAGK